MAPAGYTPAQVKEAERLIAVADKWAEGRDNQSGQMKACKACHVEFRAKTVTRKRQANAGQYCSRACFYNRGTTQPPADRFWAKVDKNGPNSEHRPDLGACWIWTGAVTSRGYGCFNPDGKLRTAHTWAYEAFVAPIPDGHHVDHLCRVRRCVNYERHLEPVTPRENIMRGIHPSAVSAKTGVCQRGHQMTLKAEGRKRAGHYECLVCANTNQNRTRQERAAERQERNRALCEKLGI